MESYIYQVLALGVLLFYPLWRIFKRAGLSPALSLTIFIPYVGVLISGLVLALSSWKLNQNIAEKK